HLPELAKKPQPITEQESEKNPSEILNIKKEQAESQKNPQFTIKSTNKVALEESRHRQGNPKKVAKGKVPTKGSKTGKSASAKEPVEEPIAEVIMDDDGDDVVHDDDQPQAASEPKTSKTLNLEWFKQPPSPPTPDPEWNKRQCFNALTEKLDWNNPEGDRYPLYLSKPLPLQRPPGHQTVAADYFFNNDLDYLKTFDPECWF
ncbi:hypothetical protein Tco_1498580, partial [Tanacetum coccineum]